jgi:hypothetical protein
MDNLTQNKDYRLLDLKEPYLAKAYYEKLIRYIIDFEADLNPEEEVGVRLVSFGEAITISVEDLGYWNPSIICFYGIDNEKRRVQLIQHVNQLSFLLISVARIDKNKSRIGFRLSNKDNPVEK